MIASFSEFSYGFAFTNEFIGRFPGLVAAPELPSLIAEADKGYDLKLKYRGHAKFFQFKLSTFLNGSNAIHWFHHRRAHYRIRLTTHTRNSRDAQHTVLKRLAGSTGNVLYVAPRFHSETDFNNFFLRGEVTDHSLWAPVDRLPWVDENDNDTHYMTFTETQIVPDWHSEPERLEGQFAATEHYEMVNERIIIDDDFFRQLRANLFAALQGTETLNRGDQGSGQSMADVLRDTHSLLTTQFGLRMVILVEPAG